VTAEFVVTQCSAACGGRRRDETPGHRSVQVILSPERFPSMVFDEDHAMPAAR
jgi:hypothetical protein